MKCGVKQKIDVSLVAKKLNYENQVSSIFIGTPDKGYLRKNGRPKPFWTGMMYMEELLILEFLVRQLF